MSYKPWTQDDAFGLYQTAAATTVLQICVYNIPSTTRFTFKPGLIARLAELASIAAIKMPLPQTVGSQPRPVNSEAHAVTR